MKIQKDNEEAIRLKKKIADFKARVTHSPAHTGHTHTHTPHSGHIMCMALSVYRTHKHQEAPPKTEPDGRTRGSTPSKPSSDDDVIDEEAEDEQARLQEAAKKRRKATKRLAKAKKDKRIRDEAAAETAEAEVAAIAAEAAAEVVTRTAANALAVARPPTVPTGPAAGVPGHFVSEPMSMAANLLIQKTTSPLVDPTQPHVLLAVMAALTQCDSDLARIKQKSLETKITRLKEDRAKLAHHQRIRDLFNIPR